MFSGQLDFLKDLLGPLRDVWEHQSSNGAQRAQPRQGPELAWDGLALWAVT
jgi:hypothetical protein